MEPPGGSQCTRQNRERWGNLPRREPARTKREDSLPVLQVRCLVPRAVVDCGFRIANWTDGCQSAIRNSTCCDLVIIDASRQDHQALSFKPSGPRQAGSIQGLRFPPIELIRRACAERSAPCSLTDEKSYRFCRERLESFRRAHRYIRCERSSPRGTEIHRHVTFKGANYVDLFSVRGACTDSRKSEIATVSI